MRACVRPVVHPVSMISYKPMDKFHRALVDDVVEMTDEGPGVWSRAIQYKVKYLGELLRRAKASTSTLGCRSITVSPSSYCGLLSRLLALQILLTLL